MVEHLLGKEEVLGSSPNSSSILVGSVFAGLRPFELSRRIRLAIPPARKLLHTYQQMHRNDPMMLVIGGVVVSLVLVAIVALIVF